MREIAAHHNTPEDKQVMQEFVNYHLGLLKKEVEEIGLQLNRIAKKYS